MCTLSAKSFEIITKFAHKKTADQPVRSKIFKIVEDFGCVNAMFYV